jgi:O-succinylbenzoic acid--CoA ligase
VRAGDRVGIALAPGEAFCIALHAILRLGAVAVPVDLRLSARERERVTQGTVEVIDGAVIGTPASEARLRARHDLGAPAIVVHTSGTTGTPKAVELTYGNWLWSALGSAVALGLAPAERWLCALPLSHVGGLSILLRSAIYGTTAVVHERFDTQRVLDALRQPDGPTIVSLVPTTLARLLDAGLDHPPALRWALLGGAPLPPALIARAEAAGVRVAPTYGLTEACSQVATAGVPLFCTRVELDPVDGEILVSGPTLSPDAKRDPDGRLRTGDLGAFDGDGLLRIVGRKADTIVTGGENVAPAEVEAVLEAHPDVLEAGVLARPDDEWGEAVVALVRLRDGATATSADLGDHARAHLARFKVPKDIMLTADPLPRTPSGKLVRRELATHSPAS